MAKSKQTTPIKSLNPFNEGVVKLISASVIYNQDGRCVFVRTFRTVDGKTHTAKLNVDPEVALSALKAAYQNIDVGFLLDPEA